MADKSRERADEEFIPSTPGEIRVTTNGKMRLWIQYALKHFETDDAPPLTLHTLPRSRSEALDSEKSHTKVSTMNVTALIPRLISIVEIIKREYLAVLQQKSSTRLHGLYQYNEMANLEESQPDHADVRNGNENEIEARAEKIIDALSGNNHVKQKQTPYMKITLSTLELPDLVNKGATYQPPLKRSLSKSAKQRAKHREKTATLTDENAEIPAAVIEDEAGDDLPET